MKETWKNLLKVKSLVTITMTLVFAIMLIAGIFIPITIPQEFIMIYTTIISFYFGTQYQKGVENNVTKTRSDGNSAL